MPNLTRREKAIRIGVILLLLPLLAAAAWYGYNIYKFSQEREQLKNDFSNVNAIQNGLLSVDIWRDHITVIVTGQINAFELSKMQEDSLRKSLDKILNALITQAVEIINEKQKSFKGKVAKFAVKNFVDVDKIRAKVPAFSQTIIDEIKRPSSKKRLKNLARDKLEDFAAETRDSIIVQSDYDRLIAKYNAADAKEFNAIVAGREQALQQKTYKYTFIMVGIIVLFLIIWVLVRNMSFLYKPVFVMSVALAIAVLVTGLVSPMIEIDVRIQELNFFLIGNNIQFHDQVLFYESKSILDVVMILVREGKADSVFVGILILVFSVVFPLTKLLATEAYLFGSERWKRSEIIRFFAFKSGKWSMADVMVVAIFMAYVGFKGILDSQLGYLSLNTESLTSIATNKTALQPGFILFIAFVLFGLILSVILKKIAPKQAPAQENIVLDKKV